MSIFQPKFSPGDKVKHKLGQQLMIVDFYEKKYEIPTLRTTGRSPFGMGQRMPTSNPPAELSGKVKCSWVNKDNMRVTDSFEEHELESAE